MEVKQKIYSLLDKIDQKDEYKVKNYLSKQMSIILFEKERKKQPKTKIIPKIIGRPFDLMMNIFFSKADKNELNQLERSLHIFKS